MFPQFVRKEDSGEHATSGEGARRRVNLRRATAGEAGTFEGEDGSDGLLGRWAHLKGANFSQGSRPSILESGEQGRNVSRF
jgi:hypothetical protein